MTVILLTLVGKASVRACICQGLAVNVCLWVHMHACMQVGRWSSSARTATVELIMCEGRRLPSYPDTHTHTLRHTRTHARERAHADTAHPWVYFLQVQCLLAFEIIKGWPFWGEAEMSPCLLHWQVDSPHRGPWQNGGGFSPPWDVHLAPFSLLAPHFLAVIEK